ncbi:MAG TPA: MOSC domain-containing protein [Thermoanaerobaculia bacterium]|nr:MOSC domain-containing protein [Thermoanaerobaculia bacterium]
MATLEAIWIKTAKRGPMEARGAAELVAGEGIAGNADFRSRRQVTLLGRERWSEAEAELGARVDPAARRANLLLAGLDLRQSAGRLLRVGAATIRLLGETRPCHRMDEAHPGLQAALRPDWRGGAWGEVVEGGRVAVGDAAAWIGEPPAGASR